MRAKGKRNNMERGRGKGGDRGREGRGERGEGRRREGEGEGGEGGGGEVEGGEGRRRGGEGGEEGRKRGKEGRRRRGRKGGGRTGICHVHCTVNFSYSTDHILSDCKNMPGKAYSKLSLHKYCHSAYFLDLYVMV